MNKRITVSLIVVAAICAALSAAREVHAAGWGSITGRIVVDGEVPAAKPLDASKDAFCDSKKPMARSLVVGKENALENAAVFIKLPAGQKIEVSPKYDAKLKDKAVINNQNCEFNPHIVVMRVGQPLFLKNSDPVPHNTKADLINNGAFNVVIPAGAEMPAPPISKAEPFPMPVGCNMHPFMEGHLLVQDHPYMAVTGADGKFEIKDIPAGKHDFQFWHETSGNLKMVKYKGGATDAKGRAMLTIEDGKTLDLGDIKVPARDLLKK